MYIRGDILMMTMPVLLRNTVFAHYQEPQTQTQPVRQKPRLVPPVITQLAPQHVNIFSYHGDWARRLLDEFLFACQGDCFTTIKRATFSGRHFDVEALSQNAMGSKEIRIKWYVPNENTTRGAKGDVAYIRVDDNLPDEFESNIGFNHYQTIACVE